MTDQHPLTDEMCEEIQLHVFSQSDEDCMRDAADWQLKQVLEWLINCRDYDLFHIKDRALMRRDLRKAMRPQQQQENNQ